MTLQLEDVDIPSSAHRGVLIESTDRWVRAYSGGQCIANSRHVLLVIEPRRLPVYYFPIEHVRMDLLRPGVHSSSPAGSAAPIVRWTLESPERTIDHVGWSYRYPDAAHAPLRNHVAFYWNKLDAWYEEDAQVFVHPRNPYSRVDVLPSSRHVKVVVDGQVVAETQRPHLLFETGLPTRYYIPRVDVRMDLLEESDTTSQCPYKGRAVYWSVRVGGKLHEDVVWSYPFPIPECPRIEQLMAFFSEKLEVYVDGELQSQPRTDWS